jgi:hypothetical protein
MKRWMSVRPMGDTWHRGRLTRELSMLVVLNLGGMTAVDRTRSREFHVPKDGNAVAHNTTHCAFFPPCYSRVSPLDPTGSRKGDQTNER